MASTRQRSPPGTMAITAPALLTTPNVGALNGVPWGAAVLLTLAGAGALTASRRRR